MLNAYDDLIEELIYVLLRGPSAIPYVDATCLSVFRGLNYD